MKFVAGAAIIVLTGSAMACSNSRHARLGLGGCPPIVSRVEWGARDPTEARVPIPNDLPYLFIHHSAMTECTDRETCIAAVKEIQDLHMDGNQWADIGYSFLIGGDGSIYEGRGWNVQGAHTAGFNSVGYGVCLMGNFMEHEPTQQALQAFQDLSACMAETGKIKVDYELYGHRQTKPPGGTDCPGDQLYALIQSWPHWVDANISKKNS